MKEIRLFGEHSDSILKSRLLPHSLELTASNLLMERGRRTDGAIPSVAELVHWRLW